MDATVPRIDPDTLRAAGLALFGERWQSELARELSVNRRTILRWLSGEWPIPADKADDLRRLLTMRGQSIRDILARM